MLVVAGVEIRAKAKKTSGSSADSLQCLLAASEPIVLSIIRLVRITAIILSCKIILPLALAAK